jgi:hypothetical protein
MAGSSSVDVGLGHRLPELDPQAPGADRLRADHPLAEPATLDHHLAPCAGQRLGGRVSRWHWPARARRAGPGAAPAPPRPRPPAAPARQPAVGGGHRRAGQVVVDQVMGQLLDRHMGPERGWARPHQIGRPAGAGPLELPGPQQAKDDPLVVHDPQPSQPAARTRPRSGRTRRTWPHCWRNCRPSGSAVAPDPRRPGSYASTGRPPS